jgi:hypothetical protein
MSHQRYSPELKAGKIDRVVNAPPRLKPTDLDSGPCRASGVKMKLRGAKVGSKKHIFSNLRTGI